MRAFVIATLALLLAACGALLGIDPPDARATADASPAAADDAGGVDDAADGGAGRGDDERSDDGDDGPGDGGAAGADDSGEAGGAEGDGGTEGGGGTDGMAAEGGADDGGADGGVGGEGGSGVIGCAAAGNCIAGVSACCVNGASFSCQTNHTSLACMSGVFDCDGLTGCGVGMICCIQGTQVVTESRCSASCAMPGKIFCATEADCGGVACIHPDASCPTPSIVRTCGGGCPYNRN